MLSTSFVGRESVAIGFILPSSRFHTSVLISPILMFCDGESVHPLWLTPPCQLRSTRSRVTGDRSMFAPIEVGINDENLTPGIRIDESLSQ